MMESAVHRFLWQALVIGRQLSLGKVRFLLPLHATLAHQEEQLSCKQQVIRSSRIGGSV